MGYIYKITNDINDKVYIGKTLLPSIEDRFKEHLHDYTRKEYATRPLYKAMKKYGIEHFSIALIGEYPDEELSTMEIYWIGYYNGYEHGYNATRGGDGKQQFNYQDIIERLKEMPYPVIIANEFGCCADIPRQLAHQYGIPIKNLNTETKKIPILRLDQQGNILERYDTLMEAGEWCLQNHLSKNSSLSGLIRHITDVAKGIRKTAYGYQ